MRYNFSKRKDALSLPNLSSIQLDSYEVLKSQGIAEILDELGTIVDYTGRDWTLAFSNPVIEKESLTEEEALYAGRSYDAPWYLKAILRDGTTKKQKTQTIYMGDIPLNSPNSFIPSRKQENKNSLFIKTAGT